MRGRTSRLKVIVSMLMLMALFVFGAVFMTACSDECAHKNMEHHEAVSATCMQTGNSEYWTCPDCNKIFADEAGTEELSAIPEIAKTDHVWEEAYQNDENGHWHKCQNCDATSASEPHTVVAIGEEKPATCTGDGITAGGKCCICNYVIEEQKTLSKLEHKLTHFNAKKANCSSVGNIEYWYCERCDSCFTDEAATQEVEKAKIESPIDPSAHKFGEMQSAVAATCTTAGTKAHKDCEYCKKHFDAEGKEITDLTIDALGHSYIAIVISVQPEKLTYFVGEDFDATGMEVTATCEHCPEKITVPDYTLSGNTSLDKGAEIVTVTWNDGTQDLTATVDVDVYQKHDLTQQGSYADFVYAASGDLTAAAAGQLSGTAADVVCGGNTYTDGMSIASGTSLTLTKEAAQGILGGKTYGDFAVTLLTDTHDQYEMSIAIVTMVIDSADDLTTITQANTAATIDAYYIVTKNIDASTAGVVRFVNNDTQANDEVGFNGIFDGRGHIISNLTTAATVYNGLGGLFGMLQKGSAVKNVAFTNVSMNSEYKYVLSGESRPFYGTIENVVITAADGITLDRVVAKLSGGTMKNCLFVGFAMINTDTGVTTISNIMSVTVETRWGGFNWTGNDTYDVQPNYADVNAMFAALETENKLQDWGDISYADGVISFNGKEIVTPVLEVSYECENNEIARGSLLTFTTDGYARLTLKEQKGGVSVEGDTVTVNESVEAGTTFTVVCTSTLNNAVKQEFTFTVIRAYQDETIAQALDFSLEGESSSVQVSVEGNIERIVAGSAEVEEGYTLSDGTLTLQKSALQSLLNGRPYAEGLKVNIYTTADKKYTATVNIVTKVIRTLTDLESIRTTGDTLDGYYVLDGDIEAGPDTVACLIGGWSSQEDKGFVGILDGRGHSITGLKLTEKGLFRCMGKGVVRNLALVDVEVGTDSGLGYACAVFGNADCQSTTFENLFVSTNARSMFRNAFRNINVKNVVFVSTAQEGGYLSDSGNNDNSGSYTIENTFVVGEELYCYYGGTPVCRDAYVYETEAALLSELTANSFAEWGGLFSFENGAILFNGKMVLGGESA